MSETMKNMQAPEVSQNLQDDAGKRRLKTRGERKFDLLTYGGLGIILNEIISYFVMKTIGKDGFAHGAFTKFESWFAGLSGHFSKFEKPGFFKYLGEYVVGDKTSSISSARSPRLPFLLVATIGGMFVVPFVKHREDNKGKIVREYDRNYYGRQADTDPAIVAAHKEMDDAPQQSWSSLWKGRVTTVLSAAAADFAFGWPEALSTKLFKNNKTWQKYGSLERLSGVVAETVSNQAAKTFNLTEAGKLGWRRGADTATWLFTLSTSLTAIFYFSSKLFARKRDEKIERREMRAHGADGRDEAPETADITPEKETAPAMQPDTKIHHASRDETLAPAAALAQGA